MKARLSLSCQKKNGRGHVHPSFFGYDNDKDLKVYFLVTRVILEESEVTSNSPFVATYTCICEELKQGCQNIFEQTSAPFIVNVKDTRWSVRLKINEKRL